MRDNSVNRFFERARLHAKSAAYYSKIKGSYQPTTWAQYGENVKSFAGGLIALGFEEGQALAILGNNRPEWTTACIAAQAAGGTSAGIYSSCSAEEVGYILEHSEATFLIVENGKRWREQVEPNIDQLPKLQKVILMDPDDIVQNGRIMTFLEVCELGKAAQKKLLDERVSKIRPEGVATLIYTSGTTGPPKAVMLSHRSIHWTVLTAVNLMKVGSTDSLVSYLPLAHVAEQMFTVYTPIYTGMALYFAESMEALPDNLKEVQPSIFFGVPRVYEKFYDKVNDRLSAASGLKKMLLSWARSVSLGYWETHHRSAPISLLLRTRYKLAKKLVFSKLKPLLGFGRIRFCVVGAAPISREMIQFFMSLDIPIYEVYGQSEDSGPTSFNVPGATKLGTVGKPIPGIDVKIADDGEILVRGPNVFLGYLKDPEASREALKQGWLCSGDIGHIDKDGFLRVTDRKKDLLITAGGKNVAPQNLEAMLKQIPLVSLAVVVGDQRKYLCALLTPNKENLLAFAEKKEIKYEALADLVQNKAILNEIQAQIDKINQRLAPVEQIKKFMLLTSDFSVESGELTPTLKVKRKVVNTRYQESIESLYA